jgi:formate hydrogenlyase subunit 6/NADH:ubiquinone oxidoreductase subunit I
MLPRLLERSQLARLVELLRRDGFEVRAPVLVDGAVRFEPIAAAGELATALRDVQAPARYQLEPDPSEPVFGVANGVSGLKRLFLAPHERLFGLTREGASFRVELLEPPRRPMAVLGARPCDLAALAIQDRILLGDRHVDAWYEARRRDAFLVAVNCTRAAGTCFCASLGSGPEVEAPHDLALTEVAAGFHARAASARGAAILAELDSREVSATELDEERRALEACARSQQRTLDTRGLPELLYRNLEHPRWAEVAERCLACGNCTMVCPTCFCVTLDDSVSLDGQRAERSRAWDSCFTPDHGYVHGKNYRPHTRDKYRQWLTHKLAGWVEQFGTSGCVGCGRCVTWCPAAIDLTVEVAEIRATARPS